jgi:predicted kinase
MKSPLIVIITGLPGTGKTDLGRFLSRELSMPYLSKDGIKEILFDTLGYSDRGWSRTLGVASYELLYYFVEQELAAGRSFIVESNFQAEVAGPKFSSLQTTYGFRSVQILCETEATVLLERFAHRAYSNERHPGHVEHQNIEEFRADLAAAKSEAIPIAGDLIRLDTTEFSMVDYNCVLQQVRHHLG